MRLKRIVILSFLAAFLIIALPHPGQPRQASAEVDIYASSVHAGCYREKPDRCKIHVEPFTISVTSGRKLVFFQLLATRSSAGVPAVIYDFRPDLSNPVPLSGDIFTPSLVAQDFAAVCGESYSISLQGRDTGDRANYNLGTSAVFTCPTGEYQIYLPRLTR